MEVFEVIAEVPAQGRGAVAAIGNFDGVHLGHGQLLAKARALADEKKRPLAVVTFDPHPRRFFFPAGEPFLLMNLEQKKRALAALGVDFIFIVPFDANVAGLPPDAFIADILARKIGLCGAVVGENFVFGRGRSGTAKTLEEKGDASCIDVRIMPLAGGSDGAACSSSKIRDFLRAADMEGARKFLGRPWEIEGIVLHGDKRGRTLGFPTANQNLGDYVRPRFGIYAAQARVEDGSEDKWRPAVVSLGIRPMFKQPQPIVETHIFDFDSDIYGKNMCVRPLKFLRPEGHYDTLQALQEQMVRDCQAARAVLKSL